MPDEEKLNTTHIEQSTECWCWAACTEMFLKYYGNRSYDQAALAAMLSNILSSGLGSQGDSRALWGSHREINILLKRLHFSTEIVYYEKGSAAKLSYEQLRTMLNGNRLLIVDVGHHSVLLSGYKRPKGIWANNPATNEPQLLDFTKLQAVMNSYVALGSTSIHGLD